ncbi:hypothetical protein EYF80_056191 [Liparis tanakae]|uniref:Uncharacterized protein n=1 Tax=Liparis tanakae TaxID=230148 RepID=A0A4Z2EY25_9TELE|nr:hypothetical protein EYF80_056191 [Liparis tanakae]
MYMKSPSPGDNPTIRLTSTDREGGKDNTLKHAPDERTSVSTSVPTAEQHIRRAPGVEAHVLEVGGSEPDGVLLLAHTHTVKRDGLLEVAVAQAGAAVPHEAEAHALRLAVVGPDVTVEQGALQPHRLALQHPVLQVVH